MENKCKENQPWKYPAGGEKIQDFAVKIAILLNEIDGFVL